MKKLIPFILALTLLTGCSGGEQMPPISSDIQRMLETAKSGEAGSPYAQFEKIDHLTAAPIGNVGGTTLEIDAEVILPDTDHVPIAAVKNRKLTQEEADRILETFIGDRRFVCDDGVTPANRELKNGPIQGKVVIPTSRYSQKEFYLQITEDGAAYFREPFSSFESSAVVNPIDKGSPIYELLADPQPEQELVDELIGKLNIADAQRSDASLTAFMSNETVEKNVYGRKMQVFAYVEHGYLFEYYPALDGVPITYYPDSTMLERSDKENTSPFERITVGAGSKLTSSARTPDVLWFQWEKPYDKFEILEKDAKLLPLEEIMEIFRTVVQSQSYDIQKMYFMRQLNPLKLTKIQLNEMYIPNEADSGGLLVPVWDFTVEISGENNFNQSLTMNRIMLTLNAVDGTVMSRIPS